MKGLPSQLLVSKKRLTYVVIPFGSIHAFQHHFNNFFRVAERPDSNTMSLVYDAHRLQADALIIAAACQQEAMIDIVEEFRPDSKKGEKYEKT